MPNPNMTYEGLRADIVHVLLGGDTPTGNMRLTAPSLEVNAKAGEGEEK